MKSNLFVHHSKKGSSSGRKFKRKHLHRQSLSISVEILNVIFHWWTEVIFLFFGRIKF